MAIDPAFVEKQADVRERTANFRSGERWINGVLVGGPPSRPSLSAEQAEPGWGKRPGDVSQDAEQRVLDWALQEGGPVLYALMKAIVRLRDAPSCIDLLEWVDEARKLLSDRGMYVEPAVSGPVAVVLPSDGKPTKPKRVLSEKQKAHLRRMLDTRWGAKRQVSEQVSEQA